MTGTMFFPALLPDFRAEWSLTNTEAGLITGIFFAGYAVSAPVLVSLTDRLDPRRIYLVSALLGVVSLLGFGLFVNGMWSAAFFRLLAGISLAGTYMPGLKVLSEKVSGVGQSRSISFYTSSYGIGTAASVFLAGLLFSGVGWKRAACLLAVGPAATAAIFTLAVQPRAAVRREAPWLVLLECHRVLANRRALGYVCGYGAHCWELFGFRSWLVAFLFFCASLENPHASGSTPSANIQNIATLIILAGVPASIIGNEGAILWGRDRAIIGFMLMSGAMGCLIGFFARLPLQAVVLLCLVYCILIMLDSGSMTSGLVAEASPHEKGMTLALYSFAGFSMAFLAPLVFGSVLDIFGRGILAWGLAFAALGVGNMAGAAGVSFFSPEKGRHPPKRR